MSVHLKGLAADHRMTLEMHPWPHPGFPAPRLSLDLVMSPISLVLGNTTSSTLLTPLIVHPNPLLELSLSPLTVILSLVELVLASHWLSLPTPRGFNAKSRDPLPHTSRARTQFLLLLQSVGLSR